MRGRDYTPDDPCQFIGSCMRSDAERWSKHARDWIAALSSKASNDAQREQVKVLARRHREVDDRGCRFNCGSAVSAFISTAKLAKAMSDSWGQPVTAVNSNWGWVFPLELPIPGWIKNELVKQAWGKFLPLLIIIALLFLNNRRKGSWI